MPLGLRPSFRFRLLLLSSMAFQIGGSLLCPTSCRAAAQENRFARKNEEPKNQEPLSRQDTADDPTKSSPNLQTSQERSEEHTSELQSQSNLVCRLLLEKKKKIQNI